MYLEGNVDRKQRYSNRTTCKKYLYNNQFNNIILEDCKKTFKCEYILKTNFDRDKLERKKYLKYIFEIMICEGKKIKKFKQIPHFKQFNS